MGLPFSTDEHATKYLSENPADKTQNRARFDEFSAP